MGLTTNCVVPGATVDSSGDLPQRFVPGDVVLVHRGLDVDKDGVGPLVDGGVIGDPELPRLDHLPYELLEAGLLPPDGRFPGVDVVDLPAGTLGPPLDPRDPEALDIGEEGGSRDTHIAHTHDDYLQNRTPCIHPF
jgi:hypothetical protein